MSPRRMDRLARVLIGAAVVLAASGVSPSPLAAGGDAVLVRTSMVPEDRIWVGQKVTLRIDVLAPAGWPGVRIGPLQVAGAYVLRLQSQGTRLNETVDGVSFQGQRRELYLYPQRSGPFTVAPVELQVEIAKPGTNADAVRVDLATDAMSFSAIAPPGTENLEGLITTRRLEGSQQWQPATRSLRVGDAVKRIIELRADDVPGMAFTPLTWEAPPGVAVYGEPAILDDRFNRGALTGARTESATYVFERAGSVSLPALSVAWWDPTRAALGSVTLDGLELQVAPGPSGESAPVGEPASSLRGVASGGRWGLLAALFGAVAFVVWRYHGALASALGRRRRERDETERAYFRRFRRAVRERDSDRIAVTVMQWLDRIDAGPGPARLDRFLERFGDESGRCAAQSLWRTLATGAGEPDVPALARSVAQARRRFLAGRETGRAVPRVLPDLNP